MTTERTYRGVPAEVRRAQRQRQLLDAALDVWGSATDGHVTMTAICQSAQLTERYFYESFADLDAALVGVVDEIAELVQRATVLALAEAGTDPIDRVAAIVDAFAHTMLDDRRIGRAALVEAQAVEATRPRRELILRRVARLAAREARKLDGPAAWSENEGPLQATMFVGGLAQLVTTALDDDDGPTLEEIRAVSTRTFRAMTQQA